MENDRRTISFENLGQVEAETRSLLATGYSSSGNWNLSQVCGHLNDWIGYAVDGYPVPAAPIRLLLWSMKVTIGRKQLEQILESGFRDKLPTMPATVYAPDADTDEQAVERFAESIHRFQAHQSEYAASPIYGTLTRDQALRLQLQHCAHHLSFLTPHQASG